MVNLCSSGVIDSSGITLTYTPSLREHDAGVMELGLEYTNKMAIPPHQTDFQLTGYCVAECSRAVSLLQFQSPYACLKKCQWILSRHNGGYIIVWLL